MSRSPMDDLSQLSLEDKMIQQYLPETIEKLETISVSSPSIKIKTTKDSNLNPFVVPQLNNNNDRTIFKLFGPKCECSEAASTCKNSQITRRYERIIQNPTKFKPKSKQKAILKEPILKYINDCVHTTNSLTQTRLCVTNDVEEDDKLKLVNNTRISRQKSFTEEFDEDRASSAETTVSSAYQPSLLHCSQQARMNVNIVDTDISIDELASYFETFVHIPKKMSSMAEMMYI